MIYMATSESFYELLKSYGSIEPDVDNLTIAKQTSALSSGLFPREVRIGNRMFVPAAAVENGWIRKADAGYLSFEYFDTPVHSHARNY